MLLFPGSFGCGRSGAVPGGGAAAPSVGRAKVGLLARARLRTCRFKATLAFDGLGHKRCESDAPGWRARSTPRPMGGIAGSAEAGALAGSPPSSSSNAVFRAVRGLAPVGEAALLEALPRFSCLRAIEVFHMKHCFVGCWRRHGDRATERTVPGSLAGQCNLRPKHGFVTPAPGVFHVKHRTYVRSLACRFT
jgi:hypothetical protein